MTCDNCNRPGPLELVTGHGVYDGSSLCPTCRGHLPDDVTEDEPELAATCRRCGGSGGGPDPALYCSTCRGTGSVRTALDEEWEPEDDLPF